MRKKLSELISETEGNRISDPTEAGRFVTELANVTLGELSREMTEWGEALLKYMPLPANNAYSLRYGELLNLLRIFCCDTRESDYAARLKVSLIEGAECSVYVKLFKAITLEAFVKFIDRKSETRRGSSVYDRVRRTAWEHGIYIEPYMTFGELFKAIGVITRWNIGCSVSSFAERTSACCLIIKLLMVDCFRFAFPELFIYSELERRVSADDPESLFFDNKTSPYDRIESFGDDYDTDADKFLIMSGEKHVRFTLSKSEKDEWNAVTANLRRLAEQRKMADEWNEARSGLLARSKDKKAV